MHDPTTLIIQNAIKKAGWLKLLLQVICVGSLTTSTWAAYPDQSRLDQKLIAQIRTGADSQVETLLEAGADPNATDQGGLRSALDYAVDGKHLKIMQMLLDRGADANAMTHDGQPLVVKAASQHTADALRLLLDAGARPTEEALRVSCWLNRAEAVTLLLAAGVSPDHGMVWAAQGGHVKLLKRLLDAGADVNTKSPNGDTALHRGALQGGIEVVQLLLNRGARPNAANDIGETPLHMAIKGDGRVDVVRILLEAKADPNTRNKELVSPVRLAAIRGNIPVYELLLEPAGGKEQMHLDPQESAAYESDKTTDELIADTASDEPQTRKQAVLSLVARGGAIVPNVMKSLESPRPNGQLYEVLWKIGPAAKPALGQLAELLADKHHVVIARLTMDRIKPGHFAQLPHALQEQADLALYEALTDDKLQESAQFFSGWLTDESRLRLLRSQQPERRALGVANRTAFEQRSEQVEAELIRILLSNDEPVSARGRAARALGRSDNLSEEAKSALIEVMKASLPYAQNVSDEESVRRAKLRSLSKVAGGVLGRAGPQIIGDLLPLLTPLDNHLRPGAMEALFQLGSAGVPPLIKLLAHEDEAIAISASVALNRIGKPAVPALVKALDSKNDQVAEQALSALWWIGPGAKEAIPSVLGIVGSMNRPDRIRTVAARTALKIDPKDGKTKKEISEALPAIILTIKGRKAIDLVWAAEVLSQLGRDGEPALPALRSFLEDDRFKNNSEYSVARRSVARAVGDIEEALSP